VTERQVEIVELLASPVHRFEGRPADGPAPAPGGESVDVVELRAGLGIVGDRYFAQRAHRDSSVTVQSAEALDEVAGRLGVAVPGLSATRRNILVRGADIDALAGEPFSLNTGDGEVLFSTARSCRPCGWLNVTVGAGAHRAFRDRGGIRTGPLTDGRLRVGPAVLRTGASMGAAPEPR
jgi:MOSC domain-containing protein YiiM